MSEHEPHQAGGNRPLDPTSLPADLAEFLQDKQFGCLTHPTDQGTVLIIKAPQREIRSAEGVVPITLRHELYECPTAPVIRMLTTIYDRPERPLALESFFNVEQADQRSDYEALTRQAELYLLFYDERLQHRLTKMITGLDHQRIAEVLRQADEIYRSIPEEEYSFEIAKAWVMARTTL